MRAAFEDGRGVTLLGAAGVGKTRLAREQASAARSVGWHVETLVATRAAASIPFGVFSHLDDGRSAAFLSPAGALRRLLLERAAGRSLLLVVDDAHCLDDPSAALVHQLALSGDAVVLATVRSREPCPDAVVALWKEGICDRLDLQALSDRETGDLLEAVLGGRVHSRTRHDLWEATRGNLLFLRELVADGLEAGRLVEDGGCWRWRGELRAPSKVVDLIRADVARLEPTERQAVEFVALAEPLEWELLESLVAGAAAAADDGVVAVERDQDGRLTARLSHPLVGDVIISLTTELALRGRLRSLANACRARGSLRRSDILRIVGWLEAAGEDVDAHELALAAKECVLVDPPRAERWARTALERGGGVPALLVLCQHLMFSRRATEAAELLADPPIAITSGEDRVAVAAMAANNLTFGLGRGEEAVASLDEACAAVSDEMDRNRLLAQSVPMLLYAGRVSEARDRADRLRSEPRTSHADRLRVAITRVAISAVEGFPATARNEAADAFDLIGAGHDELPYATGQLAAGLILAMQWSGDLDGADAVARLGYDQGVRERADLLRGVSALHLGVGALWRGRVRTAHALLQEAVDALRESDMGMLGWATDNLEAATALAGLPPVPVAQPKWRHKLYETERLRLLAVASAARSDTRRAVELDLEAASVAESMGLVTQHAFALFDAVRHGGPPAASKQLADVVEGADGGLLPLLAAAGSALSGHDGQMLDDASASFEAMGFGLFAAEAARTAAVSHRRSGFRPRSAASNLRAERLAAGCEGARTPLLRAIPELAETALTPRESDVAELAASGWSNLDIAARLAISPRTVETHLHRVYAKFGVRGRDELAGVLVPGS